MVIVVDDSDSESSSSDHGNERGKSPMGSSCGSHLKSYFVEMGFSPNLVDKVFKENDKGDGNVDLLLENLLSYSESTTETRTGTMEKTLCLLKMGFSSDAVSSAVAKIGADIPISEIADSSFANQIAHVAPSENDKDLPALPSRHSSHGKRNLMSVGSPTPAPERSKRRSDEVPLEETVVSSSNATPIKGVHLDKRLKEKKPKHQYDDYSTFLRPSRPEARKVETQTTCLLTTSENIQNPIPCRSSDVTLAKPPYFLYGNVVDLPHDTWTKLSQFLYRIEPEYVNTQFFSVLSRKEGYIHNLPTDDRFHILPKPPMTIEDTMPHTKKWWPTWDTRKQFGNISFETTGMSKTCERLGKILSESGGKITKAQLIDTVHQCKKFNLIWTGEHKLSPIEPDQVERILGYPLHHTQVSQFNTMERLGLLKHSFQIDTLAYHLSVLRWIFPGGITVLSLYSGIGGAEVALHRLGLHVKGLVSVESSATKQKILSKWWHSTEQTGELVQIQDINKLTSNKLESLRKNMGDFDLVIGINPCARISRSSKVNSDGENRAELDFPLFFEFVRVLQYVRSMGRNR